MPALGQYQLKCKRGHLREGDNLLVTSNNQRVCRKCHKIRYENYVASEHGQTERKKTMAKYVENNKDRIRVRMIARMKKAREFVDSIKSSPCTDCGVVYQPCVMDLDHVRGVKKRGISQMVDGGYTIPAIQEELEKCEVVCANCHRIRTHVRRQTNG